MGENKVKYEIVDSETGEITQQIYENQSIHISDNLETEYEQTHDMNFNKNISFAKLYTEAMPILTKKLSASEFKFLCAIIPHVLWEECILGFKNTHGYHFYDLEELSQKINIPYNTTRRIFKQLKLKGITGSHQTGSIVKGYEGKISQVYTVNPFVFLVGQNPNKLIVNFYSNSGWDSLDAISTHEGADLNS